MSSYCHVWCTYPNFFDSHKNADQGETMNYNAGLRTESVHMTVADFVELEQPTIADIAAAD